MRMETRREHGEIAKLIRHAQALAKILNQLNAACFMANVLRPFGRRRRALAKIMH